MRHTKAEFYFAGATEAGAVSFCKRFLDRFDGWTLQKALGGWKCAVEESWTLTIVAPSDTPAHIAKGNGQYVLLPAEENSFDIEARNIAENLALEFKQEAVAYDLTPVSFALTSGQARYFRNG